MYKRLKCSVCGSKALKYLINVQYSYMLWVDTICLDCFKWMDKNMQKYSARECKPVKYNNPFVVYYYDKHMRKIRNEQTKMHQM